MINVHVKISGVLIKPQGKENLDVKVKPKTTIRQLLLKLGYDVKHIPRIMTIVRGTLQQHDYVLENGDDITLSIIIGGG